MNRLFHGLAAILASLLLFSGCAAPPTAVSSDTELQANEGLVFLRVVNVGNMPILRLIVGSDSTAQEYPLRAVRFGQTTTMTYVGRLPAGRYQPKTLWGSRLGIGNAQHLTVPLTALTGKFDVEARRLTDLGTMIFVEVDGQRNDVRHVGRNEHWTTDFALSLDPTSVPTEALIQARFPLLGRSIAGKSALSWVPGSLPPQPPKLIDFARQRTLALTQPVFMGNGGMLAGGALGVVDRFPPGSTAARRMASNTVHAISTVIELKDGRWLAGGEEGYVAVSADAGASWRRLAALAPEAVIIHLSQAPDGRLFMVADMDREAVVYESAPGVIDWKPIRRIPSAREEGILTQNPGEAARFLPDFAAASPDSLVVFTRPSRVSALDLRSGEWQTYETPRSFNGGIKLTRDGYLVGMFNPAFVYGSLDYGKTWQRLESWANMTQPHFIDRKRGVAMAADLKLSGLDPFKMRFTEDGGKTWKEGANVNVGWQPWPQPLWTDPDGTTLYTVTSQRRLEFSRDQGKTWH